MSKHITKHTTLEQEIDKVEEAVQKINVGLTYWAGAIVTLITLSEWALQLVGYAVVTHIRPDRHRPMMKSGSAIVGDRPEAGVRHTRKIAFEGPFPDHIQPLAFVS